MSQLEAGNVADLDAVAGCCRILGALFYYPPDHAAVAPIVTLLREGRWPQACPSHPGRTGRVGADMVMALAGPEAMKALLEEHQRLFIGPDHLDAPPWRICLS
jgi:TorA maturation chaperone TorD